MEDPSPVLSTANPDAMTYTTDELGFTLLGGIRLDGLDRMRVTLKIEVVNRKFNHYLNNADLADLAIRHNLDLYNDVQVEKLIRKTAERLEVGVSGIAKAVSDITGQLETYRLQQIKEQKQVKEQQKKQLSEEELKAATEFLSQPHLMERTGTAIGKSGVVGEEQNRLLMYLIFTSRKREQPLHLISLGSSGTGKTYLQEKVSELIPQEDKIEITTLSDNAFYYFERTELRHKLVLIEDFAGALGVLYPLRELKSKQRITKTVTIKDTKGNTKTIHLTVEGPVCIAGCTTQESIYEDNANRSFLIYLDESAAQDERIMDYQRKKSAGKTGGGEERKTKELLQNTQRVLQQISVRNPYAEQLKIPQDVFKPRRTNSHYLQFIESVTFYHQYQREQQCDTDTGELFIETTLEDIAEANKLMKEVLLRKSDELSGASRTYFEKLKQWLLNAMPGSSPHRGNGKGATFTNREIRTALRVPLSTVKRYNLELVTVGCLKRTEDKKEKGYRYEVVSYEDYKTLQSNITTVLDDIYSKLHLWSNGKTEQEQLSSPVAAHVGDEPPKLLKKKKVSPAAQ